MKIKLLSNGHTQIHLEAETPIESAFLETMRDGAKKGRPVHLDAEALQGDAMPHIVISMDK